MLEIELEQSNVRVLVCKHPDTVFNTPTYLTNTVAAQVYDTPKPAVSVRFPDTFYLLVDLEHICIGYGCSGTNPYLNNTL